MGGEEEEEEEGEWSKCTFLPGGEEKKKEKVVVSWEKVVCFFPVIFSKNFMKCFFATLGNDSSYLHSAALFIAEVRDYFFPPFFLSPLLVPIYMAFP